jgi:hypothetical protein
VTPERLPLCLLDARIWARQVLDKKVSAQGRRKAVRWIKGYERIAETASSLPHTRLVYVSHSEVDMIALMVRAQQLGTPADWLILMTHDRALPEGAKLWSAASEGEAIGEIVFAGGSGHGVKGLEVHQQVLLRRIELPTETGPGSQPCVYPKRQMRRSSQATMQAAVRSPAPHARLSRRISRTIHRVCLRVPGGVLHLSDRP